MPQQTILAPFAALETPGETPPLAFGADSQIVHLLQVTTYYTVYMQFFLKATNFSIICKRRFAPKESGVVFLYIYSLRTSTFFPKSTFFQWFVQQVDVRRLYI